MSFPFYGGEGWVTVTVSADGVHTEVLTGAFCGGPVETSGGRGWGGVSVRVLVGY